MELKENIPNFLASFLSRPASSIPKGAQWIVRFETPETLVGAIDLAYQYEPKNKFWKTTEAANVVLAPHYQLDRGCLFAQAISLPGERIQTNPQGIQSNSLIRSRVGGGRDDFGVVKITFLETSVSLVDTFMRGWALATSSFGLIAREKGDPKQYRTILECYKFGLDTTRTPYVVQQMAFYDLCCVSVSDEEYNYTPLAGRPIMREAEFIFNSYSVDAVSGLTERIKANSTGVEI